MYSQVSQNISFDSLLATIDVKFYTRVNQVKYFVFKSEIKHACNELKNLLWLQLILKTGFGMLEHSSVQLS